MIKLFCILSIIVIPQIMIYHYFDGYNWASETSLYQTLSFGNMGYTSNYCGRNFIDWSQSSTKVNLQCQGTTRIRSMIDTGIVDVNANPEGNTMSEFNRCYYPEPIDLTQYPIMANFDKKGVIAEVMNQCNGLQ